MSSAIEQFAGLVRSLMLSADNIHTFLFSESPDDINASTNINEFIYKFQALKELYDSDNNYYSSLNPERLIFLMGEFYGELYDYYLSDAPPQPTIDFKYKELRQYYDMSIFPKYPYTVSGINLN